MELLNTFIEQAFIVVFLLSGIPLLLCSLAGLVVAILQTAMQVQEQSTVFLLKLAVFVGSLFLGGEYFFSILNSYLSESLSSIASLGSLL